MLQTILGFITAPLFKSLVEGYKAKLAADGDANKLEADLAARELQVQRDLAKLQHEYKVALIGHWYEPVQLLCYIIVFYVGKVVVWDIVLGLGTTDPIRGSVGEWAGMTIAFMVGARGAIGVARAFALPRR